jgi:5,10-methenyltetrahydrofolate synthetase
MTDKQAFRQKIKKLLPTIVSLSEKSIIISKKLITLVDSYRPKNILIFEPLKYEVELSYIRPELLPKSRIFIADQKTFGFYELDDDALLTEFEMIDFLVAPGLAFDKQGYRLGRGGGWYDRVLSNIKPKVTAGVCVHEQLFEKLPTEIHDHKFDIIITNEATVINK